MLEWLTTLDPTKLAVSVTIDKNSSRFTNDNWANFPDFINAHSTTNHANIVMERVEETICSNGKNHRTLMGVAYYPSNWEVLPADFLHGLHHIDPATLEFREGKEELLFANFNEAYPDCPVKIIDITEEE